MDATTSRILLPSDVESVAGPDHPFVSSSLHIEHLCFIKWGRDFGNYIKTIVHFLINSFYKILEFRKIYSIIS